MTNDVNLYRLRSQCGANIDWIVQRLDNRSEWCRTDDGTRFGNAVKQICCQKKLLRVRVYTCVHACTWAYIRRGAWVCAAGHMRIRGSART